MIYFNTATFRNNKFSTINQKFSSSLLNLIYMSIRSGTDVEQQRLRHYPQRQIYTTTTRQQR